MSNPEIRVGDHTLELVGMSHAVPASAEDLVRDANGYTNVHLHRRVDSDNDVIESGQVTLSIIGTNSYRGVTEITHTAEYGVLNTGHCLLVDAQGVNRELP